MADPAQRHEFLAANAERVDQNVKIEQLLLVGLEHYLQGRFERAIDVWTRVLFLERHHARAQAYIDRARAAIAERLRESEVYLHAGVEACDRGDAPAARALLTTAIERGGTHDEAWAALTRVQRLEEAGTDARISSESRRAGVRRVRRGVAVRTVATRPTRLAPWAVLIPLLVGALGASHLAASWAQLNTAAVAGRPRVLAGPPSVGPAPLPAPSLSQLALERATSLDADQQFAQALGVLGAVGRADGVRAEVDVLRASIQRKLLAGLLLPDVEAGIEARPVPGVPTESDADGRTRGR